MATGLSNDEIAARLVLSPEKFLVRSSVTTAAASYRS
jgi:hypothetical protein